MPAPWHPRGVPLEELGLPKTLFRKLCGDGVIHDTYDLRILSPLALSMEWKVTAADVDRINKALLERGMHPMDHSPDRAARGVRVPTCQEPGRMPDTKCGLPKMKGRKMCGWHVLLRMPIEKQVVYADKRAEAARAQPDHVERLRVPEVEWPPEGRWCSECQCFVPWIYVTGSKCKAHASRAAHATRIKAVYDLTREQYEQLFAYQGGRCYICRRETKKRLAVDHDHRTNEVRGLLCADDEWGCNVSLRRLLNSQQMAQLALAYVTKPPFQRMQEEAPAEESTPEPLYDGWNPYATDREPEPVLTPPAPAQPPETGPTAVGWNPFAPRA